MSLISIVAREDFISVVTDIADDSIIMEEGINYKELIPDTAYIAFAGDGELAKFAVASAKALIKQGACLKEVADSIQSSVIGEAILYEHGSEFEAVLAGYSQSGQAQYHIISTSRDMESFYPGKGESLYYVNSEELMSVLEKMLKMHGMGTVSQAQSAQAHMLEEAAKTIPIANRKGRSLIIIRKRL